MSWDQGITGGVAPFLDGLLWRPRLVSPHPASCEANTEPLHVEDRPCVVKSHTLLEVILWKAIHGGSKGVNLDQNPSAFAG